MALIDVVKYDGNDQEFVWKFPSEDLRIGTQLVIKPAQTAIFVKSGKIFDEFNEGTYTLKSGNIPLLNKIINLPFGGDSPFQAEVWYINLISKLDNKWGTLTPIQVEDPNYGIIVPVRAFGQFGFKISTPRKFLESLVGTIKVYSANKITEYFTGKLISSITSIITKTIVLNKISVLAINAHLDDLSKKCESEIKDEFEIYGIEILNFFIMSINIPQNDPSVIKLKEAKEKAMFMNTVGKDIYQFDKSMEVMSKAAENEGMAGSIMGTGLGLGIGLGIGGNVGNQMGTISNQIKTNISETGSIKNCTKCNAQIPVNNKICGMCGTEQQQITVSDKKLICDKCGKESPLSSKYCLHCGDVFILCKSCGTDNSENVKFCTNCGKPMSNKCTKCDIELAPNAKFCGNCGNKL